MWTNIRNVKFSKMRILKMFITAVCVVFLLRVVDITFTALTFARLNVVIDCLRCRVVALSPESLPGGGPCSLVPFQNCPMFPCSHTFSECFHTVMFRILFPCSQKLVMFPCSLRYFANVPCSPKTPGRPSCLLKNVEFK